MHIEDFNSLKHRLEPEASAGGDENNESLVLSIAVSLKRIADAVERIAASSADMAGEMAHPEWGIAPTLRRMPG